MSTEQNTDVEAEFDLDVFSAELFGESKPVEPAKVPEEVVEDEAEDDASEETDTQSEADTLADEDETGEEAPEEDAPKPKKNRFQERIDELTTARREAERKAALLEERLAKLEQNDTPKPKAQVVEDDSAPKATDTLEDGTEKYPLGEFDPQFIVDQVKHTLKTERAEMARQDAQARAEQEAKAARTALADEWNAKLGPAQERYPDFMEKNEDLISSFDGIDQAYGDYLTTTIMSLDYGTDVLYYLAENPAEAKKIVASGPAKATIALGRIEAKFALAEEEKQKVRPKVSRAPVPPTHVNKGSAVTKDSNADIDDLDAFAAKFFNKRKT